MKPDEFLPVTPQHFQVMLALARGPLHGYAIMQATEADGSPVEIGSLYRILKRMMRDGLVEPARPTEPDEIAPGKPRRYYRLTKLGVAVARAETQRLNSLLRGPGATRLNRQ